MSSYYVFVSSEDRIAGSPGNFTVNLNNVAFGVNREIQIGLDEIYFHHLQYPVRSTNDTFEISDNGITWHTIKIPTGVYDLQTICSVLKTELDNSPSAYTYTVSINANRKQMVISVPLPNTFRMRFTSQYSAHRILGYAYGDVVGPLSAHTSTYPVILDDDLAVYLVTNFSGQNAVSSTSALQAMECINIDVPFGGIVSYKANESNNFESIGEQRLSQLSIALYNMDGTHYKLPNTGKLVVKFRVLLS